MMVRSFDPRMLRCLLPCLLLTLPPLAHAAPQLDNGGFEIDFGERENGNMWGFEGIAFGEAYQVYAGADTHPRVAHGGRRMAVINVTPNQWSGIWQQLPWRPQAPYRWRAYHAIQGGPLPETVATFMKVEFYDASSNLLQAVEGERRRADTKGKWVQDQQQGTTPPGTAFIRFVLIAGDAADGQLYTNRIYWDDAAIEPSP